MPIGFNNFGAVRKGLRPKAERIVEKTARDVQRGAMKRSRVDTGQMRSGWDVSRGDAAWGGADGLGVIHREVVNPVEHTIYNELGTTGTPAQPMAGPAAEEAREPFETAMSRLLSQ